MLTGPRGCGKITTALRWVASVMRLDRPDEAGAFSAAPDAVLASQQKPVLIDEWQVVPESMGAVKRAVDAGPGPGRHLLTGSIRARLEPALWPATGRVVPLAMYGLTVGELQQRGPGSTAVERLFSEEDPLTTLLESAPNLVDYLDHALRGGFPDAVQLSASARSTWYQGYVDQLVHHDVGELAQVRSPARLAALLRAVALNTAGSPTLTTLAEAARIDHRTASTYLDLLEDLRVIEQVPTWTTNKLSRLVKAPKYYLLDSGMTAHLAGDSRQGTLKSADRLGRLIDTFVLAQIRPLLNLSAPNFSAYHLRNRNQDREVDLILESASGQVVGIEIKSASTVDSHSARHLSWLRDELGATFHRGVVLHTGTTIFPLGDRLWAMPIATLWQ